MRNQSAPPVALTIAGSDNSAGAGLQADLKTFGAFGVYGLTAVTCIVAEVPGRVTAIQAVDPKIVAEQIRLSLGAFPVGAMKTGLLHSRRIVEAVCDAVEVHFSKTTRRLPLVVDPVMIATSGDPLLKPDAIAACKRRLFPLATLVTPNLDEAGALLGRRISTLAEARDAARGLGEKFGTAFLVKGGHLRGRTATDVLFADGKFSEFSEPFKKGVATHGTGCTCSAAITAGLAGGLDLHAAVVAAKRFVTGAIGNHFRWKTGGASIAALNHFQPRSDRPRH